jgi:hypothetical protein
MCRSFHLTTLPTRQNVDGKKRVDSPPALTKIFFLRCLLMKQIPPVPMTLELELMACTTPLTKG